MSLGLSAFRRISAGALWLIKVSSPSLKWRPWGAWKIGQRDWNRPTDGQHSCLMNLAATEQWFIFPRNIISIKRGLSYILRVPLSYAKGHRTNQSPDLHKAVDLCRSWNIHTERLHNYLRHLWLPEVNQRDEKPAIRWLIYERSKGD